MTPIDTMEEVIMYLEKNRIPYHQDKLGYLVTGKSGSNIIIPGSIIKFKAKGTFYHRSSIDAFARLIDDILRDDEVINSGFALLVFVYDADDTELQDCRKMFEKISSDQVTFINKVDKIPVRETNYYVTNCGPIWSFVSDYDEFFKLYAGKKIRMGEQTYNASIAIMTDEEIERLNRYDLVLTDEDELAGLDHICIIGKEGFSKKHNPVFEFVEKINYIPLPGGKRRPCRLVDRVTMICSDCDSIIYERFKDECIACRNKPGTNI